jgi:hypothetical protein
MAEFYIGRREEVDGALKDQSIMVQTVCRLLRPLQGFNHRVYMDNFYSSVPVFTHLAKMLVWSTGTIRTNRKFLDKKVTIKKGDEAQIKKLPLGFQKYSSSGPLMYLAWYDKRPVHMLTNCHTNAQDTFITHWYNAKKGEEGAVNGKVLKEVPIPVWEQSIDLTSIVHTLDWKCALQSTGIQCGGSSLNLHW